MSTNAARITIWTIGHSTLPIGEFLALLATHQISYLADVRRFPMSRRHPQFNRQSLEHTLLDGGVAYAAYAELGGRRTPQADSRNTAWRNASFRGYADYMETPTFRTAAERLVTTAASARVAIMCAEALWWRCHRALIADYLWAGGIKVLHITSTGDAVEHPLTRAARLVDGHLSYAGDPQLEL
jgi:uncharacterized protein (DUF488 family)